MNKRFIRGVFLPYIENFLRLKHNLGYAASGMELSLRAFDRFAKSKGVNRIFISESLAKEWCTKRKGEANDTWSHRINFLRQFCIYLFNIGFDIYIPQKSPSKLLNMILTLFHTSILKKNGLPYLKPQTAYVYMIGT